MRSVAARAVKQALSLKLSVAAQDNILLSLCAQLLGEKKDEKGEKEDRDGEKNDEDKKVKEKLSNRALFYANLLKEADSDSLDYYLPHDSYLSNNPEVREAGFSKELQAAHFVALLTDLPPGWLFDCATNRKGMVDDKL